MKSPIIAAALLLPSVALADPTITVTMVKPVASVPVVPRMAAIVSCESRFRAKAQNPKSTASGEEQFTDGTWHDAMQGLGYGSQWQHAKDAPVEVQRSASLWLLGRRGTQPWECAHKTEATAHVDHPKKHAPALLATFSVPHVAPVTYTPPIRPATNTVRDACMWQLRLTGLASVERMPSCRPYLPAQTQTTVVYRTTTVTPVVTPATTLFSALAIASSFHRSTPMFFGKRR